MTIKFGYKHEFQGRLVLLFSHNPALGDGA